MFGDVAMLLPWYLNDGVSFDTLTPAVQARKEAEKLLQQLQEDEDDGLFVSKDVGVHGFETD